MSLIILRRAGLLACVVVITIWGAGCGDVFRPVANPTLRPGGDPQLTQHIVVIANNGSNPGSATTLDVSGDTNIGTVPVGRYPVHAAVAGSSTVIANAMDGTVSVYTPAAPTTVATTITLPQSPSPACGAATPPACPFLASTETTVAYITEPPQGRVAAISVSASSVTGEISVGTNPIALVETPNGKNLYAVNQGSNNVTPIATVDKSTFPAVAVGSSPVYAVASSDNALVFVVNQGSNSVSVINTANNTLAVPDIGVGASPNYAFYDRILKRVYVTNQAGNSLSIIDASTGSPSLLATIPETAGCAGSNPVAVVAIADGSRAYVANQGTNNVCVLNATNNTFFRNIAVGNAPVSIAAASDGSKVFVANSGSGTVSDIRTSDDTVTASLPVPHQQTPVLVIAAP